MVTVFTPTFNRAYIIGKLFESLSKQTNNDFEWIIVDDGSTDGTEALVAEMTEKATFEIVYVKQENGGKHRAINRGVGLAHGDAFFIVDSDDHLTDDAIEKIHAWLKTVDGIQNCAGVSGLRGYNESEVIGGIGNSELEYTDAKNTDRVELGLSGDKAEIYFTDILRKYPFPEFEGENFVTEEVVWNAIALDGYFVRWFKEIIYICNYLDDGLTKSGDSIFIKNPQGTLFWARQQLSLATGTKTHYKAIYKYYLAVRNTKTKSDIAKDLGISKATLRFVVMLMKLKRLLGK